MKGTLKQGALQDRKLRIYLPPSYTSDRHRYPVVYVKDYGDLFDPDASDSLLALEGMFADGTLPELVLVGVQALNRNDEYTPWKAAALSDKFSPFGGKGEAYLSFLTQELKPYIDSRFRTNPAAEQTAIIGKSLGGLISMFAACRHPGIFGKIGSISGSYWYPGMVDYLKSHARSDPHMRIYMDVGTLEGAGKQSIQKDMVPLTRAAYEVWRENGLSEERLTLVAEEGGLHEHRFFCRRFPQALRWLFAEAAGLEEPKETAGRDGA
ncbi:putative protein YbbA [Paenibacillus solanacearum]|uniref:Alpha/beta hydrolase n=1 Tax=Paenibacillus solanacearum TaxID=2048548 RepID=A0A916NJR1_9BACL|nr:alpha/beta hydrolase-fold protein [Paenibacillus solanacearum]CAG7638359.1 putative protein YbbA [Paenibacillus solanacearum]